MAGSRRARRAPCRNPQEAREIRAASQISPDRLSFHGAAHFHRTLDGGRRCWHCRGPRSDVAVRCRWSSRHCHRSGDSRRPLAACRSSLSRSRRLVKPAGSRHRCSRRRGDRRGVPVTYVQAGAWLSGWHRSQNFSAHACSKMSAGARRHVRFLFLRGRPPAWAGATYRRGSFQLSLPGCSMPACIWTATLDRAKPYRLVLSGRSSLSPFSRIAARRRSFRIMMIHGVERRSFGPTPVPGSLRSWFRRSSPSLCLYRFSCHSRSIGLHVRESCVPYDPRGDAARGDRGRTLEGPARGCIWLSSHLGSGGSRTDDRTPKIVLTAWPVVAVFLYGYASWPSVSEAGDRSPRIASIS